MAPSNEFLMYETEDGKARIECRFSGETLWLSQAQMAELFQTTPQNITLHLKALYEEGEINKVATCKDFLQVRTEGKRSVHRTVQYYNLDAVLASGDQVSREESLRSNDVADSARGRPRRHEESPQIIAPRNR